MLHLAKILCQVISIGLEAELVFRHGHSMHHLSIILYNYGVAVLDYGYHEQ